jgi:[pyruvate, water dikinase]-phosphate phosphotransferase / [pyruvate, water dikinase] kinase
MRTQSNGQTLPPVFVVSGAMGASGEQLVRTALAQFHRAVPVVLAPHVRTEAELAEVVENAAATRGTVVYTLVNRRLRGALAELAQTRGVPAFDLMGPLLERLVETTGEEPAEQPGLYRQQREAYFERIAAIEFSVAHDDGQRISELPLAEIVLVGVSRSGKTPLSMYLAVMGWKVANVPLMREIPPPAILLEIDPRRVVGLTVEPGQLIAYRKWRQAHLGAGGESRYTDGTAIFEEVLEARRFCQRRGFAIVDATDKPIESCAEEVISRVTRILKAPAAT